MYFYFDESGSFAVPRGGARHRAGVVVGVAVPDHVAPEFERRYRDFASTTERSERVNGEPKGALLCSAHQKAFGELITRFRHRIMVTSVALDLSVLAGTDYASIGDGMADAVTAWIPRMKHEGPQHRLDLLARQVRNLSDNQTLRVFALAYCFSKILEYSIKMLSYGEFEQSWEDLHFVVDRVQVRTESREERVFSIMVMSWLWAWSEQHPFGLIREIHTRSHPIVRNYTVPEGLDIGKMLRGRIAWENSATTWGLQVADVAAAIIGKAIHNSDSSGAVSAFVRVMRASHLAPAYALNVFTPHPTADPTYLDTYQTLVDALSVDAKRRKRRT